MRIIEYMAMGLDVSVSRSLNIAGEGSFDNFDIK